MIASPTPTFAQLIQDFFCRHLINQRDVSDCTVASYRDTFRIFLEYLENQLGKQPSKISLNDVTADNIEAFLNYLEERRKNSTRTRNNRFAALRSFLKYAAARDLTFLPTAQQVLAMPMKRFDRPLLGFLSQTEVQAVLNAPNGSKWTGRRDRSMFATLYNTGARVSELAALKLQDVSLDGAASVRIYGKGRKERTVPLWKDTTKRLKTWMKEIDADGHAPLFPNASRRFLTRSGVEYRLKRAVADASAVCLSLKDKTVSPHTIRHTTAMHLLQSGVDITVIALWLGHESIETTHLYVEADLAMKEHALNRLEEPKADRSRFRPSDGLMKFLERL